jgi:chaperonin GroES
MSVNIKPLGDRLVMRQEEAKTQTASGLYLPESSKEKPKVAKVEAVGPDVKGVKAGDRVLYKEYSTTDVKLENVEYLLIKEEDVLAKLS